MSPTCPVKPNITLRDLYAALPDQPLYGSGASSEQSGVGWLLSPVPYGLTRQQVDTLHRLGRCLFRFSKSVDLLYRSSLKDPTLQWVRQLFENGKPQSLLTFSQMNRFKQHVPLVIRPDLLVTEQGFVLCEIDAVPGGLGFTAALHKAYRSLGYSLVETDEGLPQAFLNMLIQAFPSSSDAQPMIAVIVSDEASDYRQEMAWLVTQIQTFYPAIVLLHPREVILERTALGFLNPAGQFQKIDIVYRFFELFDLPNIPQIELIQYAVKKGYVFCTPPFKPHLEEKLALALLHYPYLDGFWEKTLGQEDYALLKGVVPESWLLDPTPVPAHAQVVPTLRLANKTIRDFNGLLDLTQKQRELVIKPSGFSPLAWGSRGIRIGHDLPQQEWHDAVQTALSQFYQTPHLLQRFMHTGLQSYSYFHPATGEVVEALGRTRLCPYYFVSREEARLAGILATTCPKEKKIIHGMRDGVMRPACELEPSA